MEEIRLVSQWDVEFSFLPCFWVIPWWLLGSDVTTPYALTSCPWGNGSWHIRLVQNAGKNYNLSGWLDRVASLLVASSSSVDAGAGIMWMSLLFSNHCFSLQMRIKLVHSRPQPRCPPVASVFAGHLLFEISCPHFVTQAFFLLSAWSDTWSRSLCGWVWLVLLSLVWMSSP